jgi:hypothetical protein
MTNSHTQQLALLQSEIAALEQALGALAALPEAQRPLKAQLDTKQRQLHALQLQSGGVNFGVGNSFGSVGDIVFGDKHEHHGPDPGAERRALLARYLDRLAADCYHLPLRGVEARLDGGDGLALPHVYVMLATMGRTEVARGEQARRFFEHDDPEQPLRPEFDPALALPDEAIVEITGTAQVADIRLRRALLAIEAAQRHQRLALLGGPGSGKSTFLRHLAWALARHALAPDDALAPRGWDARRHPIPLLLPLRALAGRLARDDAGDDLVRSALLDEIARHLGDESDAATLLDAALEQPGALLLLLDGLDEVPLDALPGTTADRATTLRAARDFLRRNPRAAAVLTCRVRAFDDALRADLGWHVETLAPFTLGQMRAFVPAWFEELAGHGQITSAQARRLGPGLLEALTNRPRLRELAGAPLLLTMMALVLYNDGALPRDRPQLYERILKLLLGQWDKVREGQSLADAVGAPDWGSERFLSLLDRLSYEAHRDSTSADGRGQLARGTLYSALIEFFEQARLPQAWEAARRCLDYFEQRSGLLLPDGRDSYAFAHLTLQEHCAGRYIALSTEDPVGLALAHRGDDRWREPLFLGAGLLRPAEIQTLLADLIDREERSQAKPAKTWYADLVLAGEIGQDRDWNYLRTQPVVKVERLQRALREGLVELLADPAQPLPVAARVRAGLLLGELGDPRFPVTLDAWRQEVERARAGLASGYFCPVVLPPGSRALWIGRYPIVNAQLYAWMQAEQRSIHRTRTGANFMFPNQPVSGISWDDANACCAWLSREIPAVIRLPTAAEWQAAAAGPEGRSYPWGDAREQDRAASKEDHDQRAWPYPTPVGCYPAGAAACGALDMAGNVWEWTTDVLPADAPGEHEQPAPLRVLRGGGYLSKKHQTRTTARIGLAPKAGLDSGFRVVLEIGE